MKVLIAVGASLFALTVVVYLVAPSQHSVIILIPATQQQYSYHAHSLPFAIAREKRVCGLIYDQANSHHHAEYNYHAVLDILSCNLYNRRQVHIAYEIIDTQNINEDGGREMVHTQLELLQQSLAVNFPLVDLHLTAHLQ